MGLQNILESSKIQIIILLNILTFIVYIYSPHQIKFRIISVLKHMTERKIPKVNYYKNPLSNIYNPYQRKLNFTNLPILIKEPLIYAGKSNFLLKKD